MAGGFHDMAKVMEMRTAARGLGIGVVVEDQDVEGPLPRLPYAMPVAPAFHSP